MKKTLMALVVSLSAISLMAMGDWDGGAPLATARATFKVVDSDGCPVTNALVSVGFFHRDPEQSRRYEAFTGTNGCATLEGPSTGQLAFWISKDGYYESSGGYKGWMEKWTPPNSPNIKNGRWQPWNLTFDVVLKKIKNPVPMYVKTFQAMIPVENTSIGFDFEKGDWVAPYGNGVNADLFFLLNRSRVHENDFECSLQVTFPNEGDGLQEFIAKPVSENSLRLPYVAPQTGYVAKWKREIIRKSDGTRQNLEPKKDQNYMFRIRTVLDKNKEVKSALYGKIYGDINYYGYIADKVTLVFTYYLNPTSNDRNIEFDPDKNLFSGRGRGEP